MASYEVICHLFASQEIVLLNIFQSFDEFEGNGILTEREFQDYHSKHIEL